MGRLWHNAIHTEMSNVSSLDRTGTSNHFIITQNAYSSFDSVYHFAKIARFSSNLLEFEENKSNQHNAERTENKDNMKNIDNSLSESLNKLNVHSKAVINLFIARLHRNILSEYKDKTNEVEEKESSSKASNGSFSFANPELIYLSDHYTASDTETDRENEMEIVPQTLEADEFIVIDDNEYHHNDKDIILIRNNIKYIVQIYEYLLFCIKHNYYLKLLYLFQNIILVESRPILRWFLFIMDRSECFGKKIEEKKMDQNIGDISDITVFLKNLESYIRSIHSIINFYKNSLNRNGNDKLLRYLTNHQQYLLTLIVDVDETRARGVSSLQYWLKSGTLSCNPDF